jgi:DNA polymerase-3 subunit gamma/tau
LETGRIAHAYLFCGPRGTGKTSTGRILAKAVNCLNNGRGEPCNACAICQAVTEGKSLDVIEIDAASNRGIDNIRELREKAGYSPSSARFKVYIVDEVHQLTGPAFSALLKTLEEPPPHIIFILATTEPHMVPATILSRCQRFDFYRLSQAAVLSRLKHICQREGIDIDTESLQLINRSATGSLRDAENILEQMVARFGHRIELAQARQALGLSSDSRIRELAKHIVRKDVPAGLNNINQAVLDGLDLRQYNRELVNYLRALLLVKGGAIQSLEMTQEEVQEMQDLMASVPLAHILKAVQLFGAIDMRLDSYSPLPLELALIESSFSEKEPRKAAIETGQQAIVRKPLKSGLSSSSSPQAKPVLSAAAPKPSPPPYQVSEDSVQWEVPSTAPAAPQPRAPSLPITSLEQLKAEWKNILAAAPADLKKTNALAFLRSGCRPVALEGDTITLAFRYDKHKEQLEKEANRRAAEKLLSECLNQPCKIQCVIQDQKEIPLIKHAMQMGARIISVEEK